MVSRVDVHMYSMASAIKDPSTSSMSWKHLLGFKTEAPNPKTCCIYKPLQPVVGQWTPLATIPKYMHITILLGMAWTVQNIPQDKELQLSLAIYLYCWSSRAQIICIHSPHSLHYILGFAHRNYLLQYINRVLVMLHRTSLLTGYLCCAQSDYRCQQANGCRQCI